jgi:hypothetical protein
MRSLVQVHAVFYHNVPILLATVEAVKRVLFTVLMFGMQNNGEQKKARKR